MQSLSTLIQTPLGKLEFLLEAGNVLPPGCSLKSVPLKPKLPPDMSVLACYGVVAQVDSLTGIDNLGLTARLLPDLQVDGGGCTGEGLEAQEWASDDYLVLVGTEDVACLRARVSAAIMWRDDPFSYSKHALAIRMEEIPSGQLLSLHFIVAWNKLPEPLDNSCWFAVNQPHAVVLSSLQDMDGA